MGTAQDRPLEINFFVIRFNDHGLLTMCPYTVSEAYGSHPPEASRLEYGIFICSRNTTLPKQVDWNTGFSSSLVTPLSKTLEFLTESFYHKLQLWQSDSSTSGQGVCTSLDTKV